MISTSASEMPTTQLDFLNLTYLGEPTTNPNLFGSVKPLGDGIETCYITGLPIAQLHAFRDICATTSWSGDICMGINYLMDQKAKFKFTPQPYLLSVDSLICPFTNESVQRYWVLRDYFAKVPGVSCWPIECLRRAAHNEFVRAIAQSFFHNKPLDSKFKRTWGI